MTNKNYCDCRQGRDQCTCKAAEPVPPAGGGVEVLAAMLRYRASNTNNGQFHWGNWSEWREVSIAYAESKIDQARDSKEAEFQVIELVDRAHATRLQAEVERLRRDREILYKVNGEQWEERNALQSELTKAREVIQQAHDRIYANETLTAYMDLRDYLSNQSAPADKGQGEPVAWSYCPECGCEELHHEVGEHKQCANCHQEWFSDIDYSDVVRRNLQKLKAERPAPVAVVPEPAFRLLGDGDVIEEGDETLNDDTATWGKQPPGVFLGMPYNRRVMLPVRRAISK